MQRTRNDLGDGEFGLSIGGNDDVGEFVISPDDGSQHDTEQLSYDEDDVVMASQSIGIIKELMKRLLKVQKQIKMLKENIQNRVGRDNSETRVLPTETGVDTEDIFVLLKKYDEIHFFLWGRLARILHDEHQRCADVYTDTLSMHDRVPFESLTHAIHHNTAFCDFMGEIIGATLERDNSSTLNENDPAQLALVQHTKSLENIQLVATYAALLVVEGSRESFLDPLSISDLCKIVVEEKTRRKRLLALSLTFSMLDQSEQAIGEAIGHDLLKLLLQRVRHLVHRIFGYPEKRVLTSSRESRGSPFRYYSAVIQSDTNSPLSSRKASPEIVSDKMVRDEKETILSPLVIDHKQNFTSSSHSPNHGYNLTNTELRGTLSNNNENGKIHCEEVNITCNSNENDTTERPTKKRKIEEEEEEEEEENNYQEDVLETWCPKKGDLVGRGPAWSFDSQGGTCDIGEIVNVTATDEVLVHWLKNVDSVNENDGKYRVFRYKYKKPHEEIVSWDRYLEIQTIKTKNINFKLEEFMLNCALVGILCHQREAVLPALQFQAIESMIHVLESVDLTNVATSTIKIEKITEERERKLLGSEEEDGAVDEDALETHLMWDSTLSLAKEEYRQVREIVARVVWVLNALLSHKKLAFIFLELDGLRQIMTLINGHLEVSTTYGCCIVLSQLARSSVLEKLLRNHSEYFEPILKFILHQWKNASNHDVQGSAGGFLFHALSFPCVVSFFDAYQGPQTTVDIIEQLLKNSEERFDIVCPGLSLAALKCFYVYLVSHLMLSTRVLFRKHRYLSVLVTNSSAEVSLPRDPATVESFLSFISATSASIPDISIETVQSLLACDRLTPFRSLIDNNFHQLLLRCAQFYFSQSRWELLAASLNVLCVLSVVPFVRPLIADARYPESGIVHLIMIVSDLVAAFQSGNTSRELHLIPCVATSLQILLHLTVPPIDKNDEAAVASFNRVCSVIRANDGVRILLEVLRVKKDAAMSAKLHFFPVVARALQLMVTLRRYADTRILFDALGVKTVAQELLKQYEDVQKEYISMMGPRYSRSEVHATGRFMDNVKCFLSDETNKANLTVSVDPVELEQRQAIIARSQISYSRESLLELISRHLESEGLQNAASILRHDAHISSDSSILHQPNNLTNDVTTVSKIGAPTLDSIIRSYLRQQHEKCTNPIATLPQFDLRKSHVYYPPVAPVDHTRNAFNRRLAQKMGMDFSLRMRTNENHLIYRYPGHLYDITGGDDDGLQGYSIAFCDNGETLIVGTSEGGLVLFDTFPDDSSSDKLLEQHLAFDNDSVSGIFVSNDGVLLSVVSSDHTIAVMQRDSLPVVKYRVEGSRAARFSNCNTYLLTTCDEQHSCRLYDISAEREVHHFSDPSWVGENLDNVASFDATSQLILSDAVLWDIRCSDKPIYRFDRFTESFCNAFHPSNLLVLIDEKVWDLRTLTMLQTVPSFKKTSSFHANSCGGVIYSFREASNLTNFTSPVLSVVESYTFETVFSTEVHPPFRAFALDPSDRYCAAILEQDVGAVVRVFSTSSGPLPGQQSFPFPQNEHENGSEGDLGENEDEDELDHDSFWSTADEGDDTDDDDDEEEGEESELSYAGAATDTDSYEGDSFENGTLTTGTDDVDGVQQSSESSEETEELRDSSMSST
ncbi:HIV-1 Vpr-binding protein [Trypanosoma theileri]|uniref:HIV-1 Vpr-binding protein n=1 Tax=Trypanosoma theileri TaxID=67003 RepID=A0A1X0P3V3_9TRYP|nr:HIV-1 Vpr-binding protein [Trypanosoma theileri]ORC91518.1 HIV-1 Vpr-binding protein [Trypanosoma theileri]